MSTIQTGETSTERRWFIAHARGPNFSQLKELGFLHMFPTCDDYVFLEDKPENKKFLRKQSELGISFVREKNDYVTVRQDEVDRMLTASVNKITVGSEIRVLLGRCENLDGTVEKIENGKFTCTLKGFNRTYTEELEIDQIVLISKAPEIKEKGPIQDGEPSIS